MSSQTEYRSVSGPVEYRKGTAVQQRGSVSGVAAVFNTVTTIAGTFGFRETISPRAFDRALQRPDDVRALFNHSPNLVLGRTSSGTLRLSKTATGLKYEVDLPDTAVARDVAALIRRGDVTGSSFGFRVLKDRWDERGVEKGKLPLRTITDLELWDVSPVTYPAYPQTSVSARTRPTLADLERQILAARRVRA